mmetsp:Transcript_3279/g.9502  ORF Transcript_3279/g.9502 Transcript_3279/m.9502 type:complete len:272 (+) Transcript_3279:2269-3084(+)
MHQDPRRLNLVHPTLEATSRIILREPHKVSMQHRRPPFKQSRHIDPVVALSHGGEPHVNRPVVGLDITRKLRLLSPQELVDQDRCIRRVELWACFTSTCQQTFAYQPLGCNLPDVSESVTLRDVVWRQNTNEVLRRAFGFVAFVHRESFASSFVASLSLSLSLSLVLSLPLSLASSLTFAFAFVIRFRLPRVLLIATTLSLAARLEWTILECAADSCLAQLEDVACLAVLRTSLTAIPTHLLVAFFRCHLLQTEPTLSGSHAAVLQTLVNR